MTQHLTDAVVKRLKPPVRGNRVTYDDPVKGFGARVTAAGARAFVLNYVTKAGRERRYTIGQFPDWQTTAARSRARELRRLIDDGGDPLADIEAERSAPTVNELCDRFEQEHLPRKRPGTAERLQADADESHPPALRRAYQGGGRRLRGYRSAPPQDQQERRHVRGQPLRRGVVEDVLARHPLEYADRQSVQGHREEHRVRPAALLVGRRAGAA